MIDSPDDWYRLNSNTFSAYVWDEDISFALENSLPTSFGPFPMGPYFLCGERGKLQSRKERLANPYTGPDIVTGPVTSFLSFREQGDRRFWLGSSSLHWKFNQPDLPRTIVKALALNGLVLFHHGDQGGPSTPSAGRYRPTWIAVNWRIVHKTSGAIIEFPEMRDVFNKFTNGLKKRLRYRVKNIMSAELKHCKMSEAFASRVRSGEIKAQADIGDPIK